MNKPGSHIMLDLYGATDPGERTMDLLKSIATFSGLEVLSEGDRALPECESRVSYLFLSGGGHAAINSWPDVGYIAMDFYSSKVLEDDKVHSIIRRVVNAVDAKDWKVQSLPRGRES